VTWMPGRTRWRWVLTTAALAAVAGAVGWVLGGNLGGGSPAASELLAVPTVAPRATARPTATAEPTTTPAPSPVTVPPVRLLTPPESRLVAASERGRSIGVEEISQEGGKTVFGRFFALPSGQEKALQIEYVSPTIVDTEPGYWEYRLFIQKQPGAAPMPLHVSFSLPQGGRALSLEVDGERQGPVSELALDLRRDAELVFRFEVEPMG